MLTSQVHPFLFLHPLWFETLLYTFSCNFFRYINFQGLNISVFFQWLISLAGVNVRNFSSITLYQIQTISHLHWTFSVYNRIIYWWSQICISLPRLWLSLYARTFIDLYIYIYLTFLGITILLILYWWVHYSVLCFRQMLF